jgi:deoxycytidine triphosphate deaminase
MLPSTTLQALGLIQNAAPNHFRDCTYDARVHAIIDSQGQRHDELVIPARGVVHVLTEEVIRMPANISGVALVKTSLCNRGLLTLNIGVIDPGFEGPLSTAILNFGSNPQTLRKGEPFLRLSFYDLTPAPTSSSARNICTHAEVIKDITVRALKDFSGDFLDVSDLTEEIASKQARALRNTLIGWGGLLAVAFALFAIFVPVAINYSTFFMAKDLLQPPAAHYVAVESFEELQASNETLRIELKRMREELVVIQKRLEKKPPGR